MGAAGGRDADLDDLDHLIQQRILNTEVELSRENHFVYDWVCVDGNEQVATVAVHADAIVVVPAWMEIKNGPEASSNTHDKRCGVSDAA